VRKRNGSARPNAFYREDFEKELTPRLIDGFSCTARAAQDAVREFWASATSVACGSDIPMPEHLIAALIWRGAHRLRIESQGNERKRA